MDKAKRFLSLHLKDPQIGTINSANGAADVETNVVLGTGDLGIASVVAKAKEHRIRYFSYKMSHQGLSLKLLKVLNILNVLINKSIKFKLLCRYEILSTAWIWLNIAANNLHF